MLKIHREAVEGDIYALVLDRDGKLGPKVHPWSGTCANGRTPSENEYDDPLIAACPNGLLGNRLFMDGATMFSAADLLSLPMSRILLGRVVQDRTGLTGRYKVDLDYAFVLARNSDPTLPVPRPSLFTVIREQWGMKSWSRLEARLRGSSWTTSSDLQRTELAKVIATTKIVN